MIVSSTYKDGYTVQLCCIPDIEAKQVEFSVHIYKGKGSFDPPKFEMPDQGYHVFPTWPEAVDFFNKHYAILVNGGK